MPMFDTNFEHPASFMLHLVGFDGEPWWNPGQKSTGAQKLGIRIYKFCTVEITAWLEAVPWLHHGLCAARWTCNFHFRPKRAFRHASFTLALTVLDLWFGLIWMLQTVCRGQIGQVIDRNQTAMGSAYKQVSNKNWTRNCSHLYCSQRRSGLLKLDIWWHEITGWIWALKIVFFCLPFRPARNNSYVLVPEFP